MAGGKRSVKKQTRNVEGPGQRAKGHPDRGQECVSPKRKMFSDRDRPKGPPAVRGTRCSRAETSSAEPRPRTKRRNSSDDAENRGADFAAAIGSLRSLDRGTRARCG